MVAIRVLATHDVSVLERVADDVFDHPLLPEQTAAFLAHPDHQLVVAIDDGVVVGMVSSLRYLHPDKQPALWINEVGVTPSHQGLGIGKQLLMRTLDLARELGCKQAWVGTEMHNAPARGLYESVAARIECDRYVEYEWDLER